MSQFNEFYLMNLLDTIDIEHKYIMNKIKAGDDTEDYEKQLNAINALMIATIKYKKIKKIKK